MLNENPSIFHTISDLNRVLAFCTAGQASQLLVIEEHSVAGDLIRADAMVEIAIDKTNPPKGTPSDCVIRFAQIAFCSDTDDLDLPNTALSPTEAERLMSCRMGFYFAHERFNGSPTLQHFKPLQKEYSCGERDRLVLDLHWILTELWQFESNTPLRYSYGEL